MSDLEVLFEDDCLVAVNKPAWWVVHPTRGARGAGIVLKVLRDQLAQLLFPVHRLDRQASGILVLARSSKVASILSSDIREGRWRKDYLGLCRGVIRDSLYVDHPVPEEGARRPARTRVDPEQVFHDRYSLVRLSPETGRRHQLRYHLKHISHPLLGDTSYGDGKVNRFFRLELGLERLFLHAGKLRLPHPVENRLLELGCPLPPELAEVCTRLARYEGLVP